MILASPTEVTSRLDGRWSGAVHFGLEHWLAALRAHLTGTTLAARLAPEAWPRGRSTGFPLAKLEPPEWTTEALQATSHQPPSQGRDGGRIASVPARQRQAGL
jgi:hypothetical protein